MPVTLFQKSITKLLATNKNPNSYLAGGTAMHFEPNTIRYSNDLDYFHDSEKFVSKAFTEDSELLNKNNYKVEVDFQQPGFIRAIVSKGNESTKVEWAHDSSWRFLPLEFYDDRGYVLHSIDLAVNKVLALVGRDESRDYLDVHHAHKNILSFGALLWASCGKDPGYTPWSLLELLKRRSQYREEDFKRLNLNVKLDLVTLKSDWLEMIKEAERLIAYLPSREVGCLYYDTKKKIFVTPYEGSRRENIICHFGAVGGVIPRVV